MCDTCGCNTPPEPHHDDHAHHDPRQGVVSAPSGLRHHDPRQGVVSAPSGLRHHDHHDPPDRLIRVQRNVLEENNLMAERNRGYFEARKIFCLNIVGSPGSGKTTLLEHSCRELAGKNPLYVIEGDQESALDAARIRTTGVPAIQINTGYGCHLDAAMVYQAVKELDIQEHGLLFIENVGNLVCPAMFDLGETRRVVVYSITEGNDKPLKYPFMFRSAHLTVITKLDLMPYVDFSLEQAREDILSANPGIAILALSVKTGEGVASWSDWLTKA